MREDIDFAEAPKCGVGSSRLCDGQGLFALQKIKVGEIVADYSHSTWKRAPFSSLPKSHRTTCWWVGINKKEALLAAPTSLFMRANHSRTPNTLWNPKKKTLTANQPILPGDEITYDYRLEIAPLTIKQNPPAWA